MSKVIKILIILIILIFLCLGIAVGFSNVQAVRVDYLVGHGELPLILLVLATLAFGFIVGWALGLMRIAGLRVKLRKSRRRVEKLETENKALNNPALKDV
jgi:uncharacterized membrane protein YciS (DUF1049 family)